MTEFHYEMWEFLAFIDGSGEVDRNQIAAHVEACSPCRDEVASLRTFWSMMSDPEVQDEASAEEPEPDPRAVSDAAALAAIQETEDALAADLLRRLRPYPLREWLDVIAMFPEQRTESLVRSLIDEARGHYERDPMQALAMLDVARAVADGMPDMFALARQRAVLAKERANALRILGRNAEALEQLEWAERFLRHLPMPEFELAFVEWTRATVLLHMTRYEEGLAAARRAVRILREYGEAARAEQVRIIEAGILYEQGQVEKALEIYERLARVFAAAGDKLTLARVEANIAECQMRRGEWAAVREHAATALELFADLGNETEQVRIRWTLAHALLEQGRLKEGLRALHEVESAFTRLGMRGEAAGVLLDIVELHLRREEWDEAIDFATRAAEQFSLMEAPLHVAQAYAYLRDAVAARQATTDLVQYVRDYVTNLSIPAAFEPPASDLSLN